MISTEGPRSEPFGSGCPPGGIAQITMWNSLKFNRFKAFFNIDNRVKYEIYFPSNNAADGKSIHTHTYAYGRT